MSRLQLDEDSLKMVRETLCVAQALLPSTPEWPGVAERVQEHRDRLQRMINEIDRQRPLGPDGKHGNRHTPTCGCTDITEGDSGTNPWATLLNRLTAAQGTYRAAAERALEARDFPRLTKSTFLADGFAAALSIATELAETAGETEAVKSATEQA